MGLDLYGRVTVFIVLGVVEVICLIAFYQYNTNTYFQKRVAWLVPKCTGSCLRARSLDYAVEVEVVTARNQEKESESEFESESESEHD